MDDLAHCLGKVEASRDRHTTFLESMLMADGAKLFGVDILAAAAVKRSMALSTALVTLVRAQNYSTAASLVRLQLDSCLRFSAAYIVDRPHEFAVAVLRGTPVRKCKIEPVIP